MKSVFIMQKGFSSKRNKAFNVFLVYSINFIFVKWRIRSKAAPHSGASRHPIPEHAGR
jgi:hypothetical protein